MTKYQRYFRNARMNGASQKQAQKHAREMVQQDRGQARRNGQILAGQMFYSETLNAMVTVPV